MARESSEPALQDPAAEGFSFNPEQAKDGLFILDRGARFCYANPHLLQQLGCEVSQLYGPSFEKLTAHQTREQVRQMFAQLMRGHEHPLLEIGLLRPGQEPLPVEVHARPARKGQRVVGVQGVCRDLRPRQFIRAEALDNGDLYCALFDLATEAVITTGANGRVRKANPAAGRMLGFASPEAMVGLRGISLYAIRSERKAVRAQPLQQGFALQPRGRFRRRDGTVGDCLARVQLVRDATGRPYGAVGFLRDTTEQQRAEAALRESEQQFRVLAEASPNMIFIVDEAKIIYANKAAEQLLPRPSTGQTTRASSLLELVPEENRPTLAARLHELAEGAERSSFESTFVCPGGRRMDTLVGLSPISIGGRRLCLLVLTDTSEQKKTERMLRDVEAKYRTLVEQAPFSVALMLLDPLKILVTNEALCRILGCSLEQLLDMEGDELLTWVHPEERSRMRQSLHQARRGQIGEHCLVHLLDQRGATHHVDFQIRPVTIRGVPLLQVTATDLTQRLEVQKALRESQERYRAIVEDQTELICRRAADGTILFANEAYCRFYGKKQEELIGTTFMPVTPHGGQEDTRAHFLCLRPSRPVPTHQHLVLNASGQERWMRWTARAFFDRRGRLTGMQSVGFDVTEQRRAEQQAKEKADDLALVARLNGAIAAGAGIHRLLRIFTQGLARNFACKKATLFLLTKDGRFLEWDKKTLSYAQVRRIEETIGRPLPQVKVELQHAPLLRQALQSDGPQVLTDVPSVDGVLNECAKGAGVARARHLADLRRLLGIPPLINLSLTFGAERVGLLSITRDTTFAPEELRRLQAIAEAVALAIKHLNVEDSLRRSEERLRHMAESIGEGLAIIEDGRVIYTNRRLANLFDCKVKELTPELLLQRAAPEEQPRLQKIAAEAQKLASRREELEYWITFRDGGRRFIRSRYVNCREQGKVRTYVIVSDLTAHRLADIERERLIGQLLQNLSEVKTLSGLLPLCASCKKIRDDQGYWHQVEAYMSAHTPAQLSFALCPTCASKVRRQREESKPRSTRDRRKENSPAKRGGGT
ncbi:MAG: PAS domain S-box protein [Candidatus Oleimicrobiaceae bacterium]